MSNITDECPSSQEILAIKISDEADNVIFHIEQDIVDIEEAEYVKGNYELANKLSKIAQKLKYLQNS